MEPQRPLAPHLRLLLEIDRIDPLGGAVGALDGPAHPFSGWIGLAGAITAWLASGEPAGPPGGDSND